MRGCNICTFEFSYCSRFIMQEEREERTRHFFFFFRIKELINELIGVYKRYREKV